MVLTRSKSNSQGTTAAAPAPAKAISPAKRKGQTSATPASKATKTEKASDISAIKNKTAEATATNSTETPAIVAAENNTANPIQAEAPATTETLTSVDTAATGPATLDMLEASAPPAPTAPTAATIPAPVDVPVLSSTAPVVVSTEEPTVHDGAAKPSTLRPYDAVVSDIEGTTCPIAFVKESLFPYVTSNLADFLKKNWSSDEMKEAVEALRIQASKDIANGLSDATPIAVESADVSSEKVQKDVIASIEWQMKADRKIGALKAFQGYMWKDGYANGDLKGVVYDDVIAAFDNWKAEGKKLYIYSSGSIPAQKLIFGFSEKGDLLHYFSGHYDTSIGQKVEAESYTKIATDIGLEPAKILFLSDNIHEINAAKEAGFQAIVTDRPGNAPLTAADQENNIVVKSFLEIPKAL